jgi:hypothetical protein
LGEHIPGHPAIIVSNMPAAGGLAAANYLGQIAPHYGTVLSILDEYLPQAQALGAIPQLTTDLRASNWIANIAYSNSIVAVWRTSATKTLDDAKRRVTTLGTRRSDTEMLPLLHNKILGRSSNSSPAIPAELRSILLWSGSRSRDAGRTLTRAI